MKFWNSIAVTLFLLSQFPTIAPASAELSSAFADPSRALLVVSKGAQEEVLPDGTSFIQFFHNECRRYTKLINSGYSLNKSDVQLACRLHELPEILVSSRSQLLGKGEVQLMSHSKLEAVDLNALSFNVGFSFSEVSPVDTLARYLVARALLPESLKALSRVIASLPEPLVQTTNLRWYLIPQYVARITSFTLLGRANAYYDAIICHSHGCKEFKSIVGTLVSDLRTDEVDSIDQVVANLLAEENVADDAVEPNIQRAREVFQLNRRLKSLSVQDFQWATDFESSDLYISTRDELQGIFAKGQLDLTNAMASELLVYTLLASDLVGVSKDTQLLRTSNPFVFKYKSELLKISKIEISKIKNELVKLIEVNAWR